MAAMSLLWPALSDPSRLEPMIRYISDRVNSLWSNGPCFWGVSTTAILAKKWVSGGDAQAPGQQVV
jgi:hypothetical protein